MKRRGGEGEEGEKDDDKTKNDAKTLNVRLYSYVLQPSWDNIMLLLHSSFNESYFCSNKFNVWIQRQH